MSDTFEKVKKIIAERLDVDPKKIVPEASFMRDLGADSLDTYDLVFAIEEAFEIEVPDDKANEVETVGDVVKYLDSVLK